MAVDIRIGEFAKAFGSFLVIMAFTLALPDLNTFFVDFADLNIALVRVMQYGFMFISFGIVMGVILRQ